MYKFLLVDLNGLSSGERQWSGTLDERFFVSFGNTEILDADVSVEVRAGKTASGARVDVFMEGTLTVSCDRCLEDLQMPVESEALLEVRHEGRTETAPEDDRELIFIGVEETELDLSQIVYDYLCLSLPIQRHHEDGKCNPRVLEYLNAGKSEEKTRNDGAFAALAGLFANKNN
ncbi:MAG: YceD family protein [Candidatus Cryptobacteroides sp.]